MKKPRNKQDIGKRVKWWTGRDYGTGVYVEYDEKCLGEPYVIHVNGQEITADKYEVLKRQR